MKSPDTNDHRLEALLREALAQEPTAEETERAWQALANRRHKQHSRRTLYIATASVIHKPTGIVVECQDERSQFKNKDKAFKILRAKLYDMKMQEQSDKIASERKSQVGTGDRSERIRTYNYPQGRVTDHRIGFTIYSLESFLNGDIGEMLDKLATADAAEKLKGENN